jgi:hypothetical protein
MTNPVTAYGEAPSRAPQPEFGVALMPGSSLESHSSTVQPVMFTAAAPVLAISMYSVSAPLVLPRISLITT